MLHACVTLLIIYYLLFKPINARFDFRSPFIKFIITHSDLLIESITRFYRPFYRMRILKSRIPRPINRFANRSDLRPLINEPTITYLNLRFCRMRISQSRILRFIYLFISIFSVSSLLISVSISIFISAFISSIGLGRYLYCGKKSCAKR
jgi:hypothetical protein